MEYKIIGIELCTNETCKIGLQDALNFAKNEVRDFLIEEGLSLKTPVNIKTSVESGVYILGIEGSPEMIKVFPCY